MAQFSVKIIRLTGSILGANQQFLLLIAVFAWPTWPYTRDRRFYRSDNSWRYAPSAAAALVAVLMILLFWIGLLAIWWPWHTPVL